MVDEDLAIQYYGFPPYYRNISNNRIEKLPFRVRMPDGSTRTDPEEWSLDPNVLAAAGYIESDVFQEDIDLKLPTLENLKELKTKELDQWWDITIANGYATPEGWKLGLKTEDVTLLTGAFLLLKESVNLGVASTTTIIDTDQNPHTLDLSTMTMLMLGYGNYRSNLSGRRVLLYNQILAATNQTELDSIIIGDN